MFEEDEFNAFSKLMEEGVAENKKYYDDTWKKEDIKFLEHRLLGKMNEFKLTKKPSKLVSLANLSMMLYIRMKEE